jgi:hypothetical protein
VKTLHGLDWGQQPCITLQDVERLKKAGGYNDDWDMCYLLASLALVRNYQARRTEVEPNILSAMLVPAYETKLYQKRGADVLFSRLEHLVPIIRLLAQQEEKATPVSGL